jgi:thermitase
LKRLLVIIFICSFVCTGIFADNVPAENNDSQIAGNLTGSHETGTFTDVNGTVIECVKNELIIQFKPELTNDPISFATISNATSSGINATIVEDYGGIGMPGIQLIRLPENVSVESAIQYYLSCPAILYAEPNDIGEIAPPPGSTENSNTQSALSGEILKGLPNDPIFYRQWGLTKINAQSAWNYTTGSDNVIIAVIDSGVDCNQPDLTENILTNTREIPNNGIDDDKNGYIDDYRGWNFVSDNNNPVDANGHGTHCAGIIAARGNNNYGITGTLWHAKIMPLLIGIGYTVDRAAEIKAIQYANSMNAELISCSFGFTYSSSIEQNLIRNSPALFICAAGNSGQNNDINPMYPANYDLPNIISVAATDSDDNLANVPGTWSSNYGISSVDIGAPGVDIVSTIPNNQFAYDSGTSMAAPFVTGVAGLIKSKYPKLTNAQIKDAILSNVDKLPSLNGKVASGGRLNAYKALKSLDPQSNIGSIFVQTNPAGAEISIDGNDTGYTTPMTISGITTGSHTLKCTKSGYSDQSKTVSVVLDQTNNVYLVLEILQSNGSIFVESNPAGARIYLDNSDTGFITPKTLPGLATGSHVIRCRLDGYNDNSTTATVNSGQVTNVTLNLLNNVTSISLSKGWNCVSTPKTLAAGYNTAAIFSTVNMGGHSVYMWDGSQNPPRWVTAQATTQIQPLYGYWIYSVSDTRVNLNFDTTNPANIPAPRSLPEGWSTIGFAGLSPASARNTYQSVQAGWVNSMGFDAITQRYEPAIFNGDLSESTLLYPTKGYWLYMRTPGTLTVIGA